MGGWKLEVGKMFLYMSFPVLTFHYFNQPQFYEEAVMKIKRETYPVQSEAHNQKIREALDQIRQQRQLEELKKLAEKQQ